MKHLARFENRIKQLKGQIIFYQTMKNYSMVTLLTNKLNKIIGK